MWPVRWCFQANSLTCSVKSNALTFTSAMRLVDGLNVTATLCVTARCAVVLRTISVTLGASPSAPPRTQVTSKPVMAASTDLTPAYLRANSGNWSHSARRGQAELRHTRQSHPTFSRACQCCECSWLSASLKPPRGLYFPKPVIPPKRSDVSHHCTVA